MEKPSGDISSSSQKFRQSDDSSPSSTRAITAASLYNPNEDDSTPILLYRQGKGSLRKVTQRELCELLDDGTFSDLAPFPHTFVLMEP